MYSNSASYDALGDMTCRAPSSSTTCAGTPTGATLAYDNEGRLSAWQDKPTSPTTTASFLYDGEGNRVEQSVTVNGSITTTTTYIAGGLEESTTTGASTTLTKYFGAGGLPTMERVGTNGPLSVLASDGQGTVSTTLDSAGNVTSAALFTPYGVSRYSSGSSPTSHGYTGQLADSSTGLDYYHARYYDPVAGQFTSADTVDDGFNRYAYVRGNPTTATDPSGQRCETDDGECGKGGGGSGSAPYLVGMAPEITHDYIRNADGTLTIRTTTRERYVWSNGRVTYGDETSSALTECDAKCHHLQRARELDKEAGKFAVGGIVLEALAAGMDFLTGGIKEVLRAVFLIADLLGNVLPYIAQWIGASSGLYQVMYHISGIFNALGGMAADALALINTWGDLALGAASNIVFVIRAAAAGVPGLLTSVAFKAVGTIIGDGFLAASYLAWSQYDALEEEAKQEQSMAASLPDDV